jgi:hypothetical protein
MSRPHGQGWHWIFPTLVVQTSVLFAATIRVPGDVGTIQEGIELSSNGDVVEVGPGSWHGPIDYGGRSITVRSLLGADKTIIDASGTQGPAVVFASGETRSSVLEGFAITGGSGQMMTDGRHAGGGLFILNSAPTIRLCLVSGNTSTVGGGIAVLSGSPLLDQIHVYGNLGGGLFAQRCLPVLLETVIEQNAIILDNAPPLTLGIADSIGACCIMTVCVDATSAACYDAGGAWRGETIPCAISPCLQGCHEDVSGDGRINTTDLLLVLAAWGMCP